MARRLAITWGFNIVALLVATRILSGLSYGSDWWVLFAAALALTLVNTFLKPLLAFLSIPFILATLGLAYFLLNVLMLYATHWLVAQFTITNFWWAALAALVVSFVNAVLSAVLGKPKDIAAA